MERVTSGGELAGVILTDVENDLVVTLRGGPNFQKNTYIGQVHTHARISIFNL